eukprot:5785442-Amphidinium_carterae.1
MYGIEGFCDLFGAVGIVHDMRSGSCAGNSFALNRTLVSICTGRVQWEPHQVGWKFPTSLIYWQEEIIQGVEDSQKEMCQ